MLYRSANFRTTVVKPYHRDETTDVSQAAFLDITDRNNDFDYNPTTDVTVKRSRERPKGSKNKPKATPAATDRPTTEIFLLAKKEQDRKLFLTLQ